MAPGEGVLTSGMGNYYGYFYGTSGSSPQIVALAGLIYSLNPSLSPLEVANIITGSVDQVLSGRTDKWGYAVNYSSTNPNGYNCTGWNDNYGCGRINAYAALLKATGGVVPTPLPTSAPVPTSTPIANSVIISNITSTTTANTATIKWTTNIPTSSVIKYGISSSNLNLTSSTTNNTVTLTGLNNKTTYYYTITSISSTNLTNTSAIQTLRTKNR